MLGGPEYPHVVASTVHSTLLAPVRYIDRERARGMTMTTSKEQEAFGLVVERHKMQRVGKTTSGTHSSVSWKRPE